MISSFECANPLPSHPSANAALTSTGYQMDSATTIASSFVSAVLLRAYFTSIASSARLKAFLSSVIRIVSVGVPSTLTPYFSRIPDSSSARPQLSAVCPQKESMIPSGRSFSMISVTDSGVMGIR